VENLHIDIIGSVKSQVSVPVAVKLSPYFSSFAAFAARLERAGADALVLFNRFLQPEIDLETMTGVPGLRLSDPFEARVPRTWISILRRQLGISLAATSGVETPDDVVKYLLAGADVICTTSALVRHGATYAADLIAGLESWLTRHEFESVDAARGAMAIEEGATDYERQGYVAALQTAKRKYASLAGL
jgi:dihydroorotate dehydrogenase (fumarate)